MTIDAILMLTGAFVATLPFLGLPNSWDRYLFLVAGVLVIGLAIVARRRLGTLETFEREEKRALAAAPADAFEHEIV